MQSLCSKDCNLCKKDIVAVDVILYFLTPELKRLCVVLSDNLFPNVVNASLRSQRKGFNNINYSSLQFIRVFHSHSNDRNRNLFCKKRNLYDVEVIISPFPRTFRNRSIRSKSVRPRSGLFRPEYGLTVVAYLV